MNFDVWRGFSTIGHLSKMLGESSQSVGYLWVVLIVLLGRYVVIHKISAPGHQDLVDEPLHHGLVGLDEFEIFDFG